MSSADVNNQRDHLCQPLRS